MQWGSLDKINNNDDGDSPTFIEFLLLQMFESDKTDLALTLCTTHGV